VLCLLWLQRRNVRERYFVAARKNGDLQIARQIDKATCLNVVLEIQILISSRGLRNVLRDLSLQQIDNIGNMLDALAAQSLASRGWMQDVQIDVAAEAVGARNGNWRKAKEIAEPARLAALLNEHHLASERIATQFYVCEPNERSPLRVQECLQYSG
jgi:hypothetical protein